MNQISGRPSLRVLACQIEIPTTTNVDQQDAHLLDSVEKVRRELSGTTVDLVALPELSSIDYSRHAFDALECLSEPLEGRSFVAWRAVAREFKTHVAYSFPRRAETGFRISLAVIGPSGDLLGYYDKLHLAQFDGAIEKDYFGGGDHLFAFEVNGFQIAPIICYDIRMPELSRQLAVEHKVDMILHSSAYGRDSSFYSWHQLAISRAIENQVFFLSLNRAGKSFGKSILCPPWMDGKQGPIVFPEHDEVLQRVVLDRAEINLARDRFPYLKDRLASYDLPLIEMSDLNSPCGAST